MTKLPTTALAEKLIELGISEVKERELFDRAYREHWEGLHCYEYGTITWSDDLAQALSNLQLGGLATTSWKYGEGTSYHFNLEGLSRFLKREEK